MILKLNAQGPVALASSFTPDVTGGKERAVGDPKKVKPIVLIPGINTIPDEEWNTLKKNPVIKQMLEEPDEGQAKLVAVTDTKTDKKSDIGADKGTPCENDLLVLNVDDARKLVRKTMNKDLLDRWEAEELGGKSRTVILATLKKQLEKLKPHHKGE